VAGTAGTPLNLFSSLKRVPAVPAVPANGGFPGLSAAGTPAGTWRVPANRSVERF